MVSSTCLSGYYLNGISCVACSVGVKTCSKSGNTVSHDTCIDGYSKISTGTTCTKCTATGAKTCTASASVAVNCMTGYYLSSGSCTACPSNTASCTSASVFTCNSGYSRINNGASCS